MEVFLFISLKKVWFFENHLKKLKIFKIMNIVIRDITW